MSGLLPREDVPCLGSIVEQGAPSWLLTADGPFAQLAALKDPARAA